MTCVIGLVNNNKVYIGCDSLGGNSHNFTIREDKKVFQIGEFIYGYCIKD